MGQVLLARVAGFGGFERLVVLKRIHQHLAMQEQFRAMFLDEAKVSAAISHPNVVHVEELGQAGNELFMVMEYLAGEPSSGLVRRLVAQNRVLPPRLAAHIVAEASAGLHAAHELKDPSGQPRNLVHRDVTPQNVFVTYDGHVKVLDFGIAKAAGRDARTETGEIKGKFEYLSPEQCRSMVLDRRSDVFALGIVLWELLTGRRLFRRDNIASAIHAILNEPVPSPSELVSSCPPSLDRICLRALERHRAMRYPTAAEMRRDLLVVVHDLGPDPAQEALAALMSDIFTDRIREKHLVMRQALVDSSISRVPAADVDLDVEVPAGPLPTTGFSSSSPVSPLRMAPRRRRSIWFASAALGLACAIALLIWWARTPARIPLNEATADLQPSSAPVAPAEASAPPAASSTVAKATNVTVEISTIPAGARLQIDGVQRGVTPTTIQVPKSETALKVTVELPDRQPVTVSVVPKSDRQIVIPLAVPKPPTVRNHKKPPSSPPPKASKDPDDGFYTW